MPSEPVRMLGFGCAGLFGLPNARDRRAVLECAYDLGIRHFDVAPIYGLGLAEVELAEFRNARPDVIVATKFGIEPTSLARLAGTVQGPARRALRKSRSAQARVKQSGLGPGAGVFGKMLYRPNDYSVASAYECLARSQRRLRTGYIDYFLLHEPFDGSVSEGDELIDFLDAQRTVGGIGAWGTAGEVASQGLESIYRHAAVFQHPYYIGEPNTPVLAPGQKRVVFGFLTSALSRVRSLVARDPGLRDELQGRAGRQLTDSDIPRLLVRDAIRAVGQDGIVLISSTNQRHLEQLVEAAHTDVPGDGEIADRIRSRLVGASS